MEQHLVASAAHTPNGRAAPAGDYETVIVATPDLAGRLVGKRITARHFRESTSSRTCDVVFGWGIGHELLEGFAEVGWEHGYGDVVLRADPGDLRPLAWWPSTALVVADAGRPDGTPMAMAPRTLLTKQVERAERLGYAVRCTSELEFTVFAEDAASMRAKGFSDLRLHRQELHPELVESTGLDEDLLGEIRRSMEASGILVESVKAEYSPSQFEMTLDPADPLEACDRHAIYKMGVRELCRRRGLAATFMSKPHEDRGGQSCHLHLSLTDDMDRNLFAEGDDRLLRQFVAGLQRYAADVFLLWAPYPNSFKRFRAGSFAPSALSWGQDNRTAAVRVCGEGGGRHVENRIPGADVNPYLAHAALLAAGLQGVEDELEPDEGIGQSNAYAREGLTPMPASLEQAVAAFAGSRFAKSTFGDGPVGHIANFAAKELEAAQLAVTDFDRRRLFDI